MKGGRGKMCAHWTRSGKMTREERRGKDGRVDTGKGEGEDVQCTWEMGEKGEWHWR